MRWMMLFGLAAFLAGCSPPPGGHKEGHADKGDPKKHGKHGETAAKATLQVRTEPAEPAAGKPATLKLMIHGKDGKAVKDFAVVHEMKVHLIIVRDGLDTFAHLHPELDDAGNIKATYTFPTGGTYRLFADHKPTGGSAATAEAEVKVTGEAPALPSLKPDVPGTVKGDGLEAKVGVSGVRAGSEGTVRFDLLDEAGKAVADLQPYMGAMGHLVVISQDGKQYVHAHPAEDQKAGSNVVAFGAHFPKAGLYKGWGQFKRGGEVRVVPFVLRVE